MTADNILLIETYDLNSKPLKKVLVGFDGKEWEALKKYFREKSERPIFDPPFKYDPKKFKPLNKLSIFSRNETLEKT